MIKLSMFQVVCVLSTSFLPLLFWVYPRYAVQFSGIDGQWAVLGACLLGLLVAVLHAWLNIRFRTLSGAEMTQAVYGRLIGKIVALLFVPGYILFVAVSIFSFSITIKMLLPLTPRLATVTVLALVAVMGAQYGVETVASVAALVFPITTGILFIACAFSMMHGAWTGVFYHPVHIDHALYGAGMLLPMFFGFNICLMLNPHFDHRNRNPIWVAIGCWGLATLTVLTAFVATIETVGYEGVRDLAHPIDFILQLIQMHGILIERFGIVLIFLVTLFQGVFFSNQLWALSSVVSRTFNLSLKQQKPLVVILAAIIVGVFFFIHNQQTGDEIADRILVPMSWFYLIIEPGIKLILSYVLGVKVNPKWAPGTGGNS